MTSLSYETVSVDLNSIHVPEDRVRTFDAIWAEALARLMLEHGNRQKIEVRRVFDGEKVPSGKEFILVAGAHRLAAFKLNEWAEMPVTLVTSSDAKALYRFREMEVMENLERAELTVLDRAKHLVELKVAYEALHPETKKGGDKGNQHTGGKERLNEIFSFSQSAAQKLGVSTRTIEQAVKLWKALSKPTRERVQGTWLANHQANLMGLASVGAKMQAKILDVLEDPDNSVKSVPEAMEFIERGRLLDQREKRLSGLITTFKKLDDDTFDRLMAVNEVRVRAWFEKRGS